MMDADNLASELREAYSLVNYWTDKVGAQLFSVGVRDRHDAEGDRLGDSPKASMVRVHARAALGALRHLSASLADLADLINPDTGEDEG